MNYQDFKLLYDGLLYLPLVSDMPRVDSIKLFEWMVANHQESVKAIRSISKNKDAEPTDGFWQISYMMHRGEWIRDFQSTFPDLSVWVGTLPMKEIATVYALTQDMPVGEENYIHFDEAVPGLRAYINPDDGMFFRHLKDPEHKPTFNELNPGGKTNEALLKPEKIWATSPSDQFLFILGNEQAPHSVVSKPDSHRKITLVIQSYLPAEESIDWGELSKLVEVSLSEYPEHVIWYSDK